MSEKGIDVYQLHGDRNAADRLVVRWRFLKVDREAGVAILRKNVLLCVICVCMYTCKPIRCFPKVFRQHIKPHLCAKLAYAKREEHLLTVVGGHYRFVKDASS